MTVNEKDNYIEKLLNVFEVYSEVKQSFRQ